MLAEQPLLWGGIGLAVLLASTLLLTRRTMRQRLDEVVARWRQRSGTAVTPAVQVGTETDMAAPATAASAPNANDRIATLTLIQGREILAVLRCPVGQVGERTIGRSPVLCDQVVEDNTVSRCHARLLWEPQSERWYVEDLGSKNGTYLNGEALQAYLPVPLRQGARLVLGGLELTVVTGGSRA